MAIRKHPTQPGVWQIIVSQGAKGKQLVFPYECSEAEALELDKQINAQIKGQRSGTWSTIRDILPEYARYYATIATPDVTTDMLSIFKRCLLPHFGKLTPAQIAPLLVHQYTAKRLLDPVMKPIKSKIGTTMRATGKTVSHRTIQKELNHLSAICRWMHGCGLAEKMPAIPKPPKNKTQPRQVQQPLTIEEINRLLDQTPADKKLLLLLMTDAGLRCQEVLQLKTSDVDAEGGRLTVYGKGGKVVVYPVLTKRLLDEICAAKKTATGNNCEYLTINAKTGKPYGSIKTLLRLAAKRAGICKNVTHHTLRHSYSTILLECGISPEARQKLMRHSTLTATQIYTHVSPAYLQQQAGEFSRLVDGLGNSEIKKAV